MIVTTFYPVQWPHNVQRTKRPIFGKSNIEWSNEMHKIAHLAKAAKMKRCVVSSNFDPELGRIVGESGISVLVENHQGNKFYYLCDHFYENKTNLREIRLCIAADLTISKSRVKRVVKE